MSEEAVEESIDATEPEGETTEAAAGESGAGDSKTEEAGSQADTPKEEQGAGEGNKTLLGKAAEETAAVDFKSLVPEGMEYDEERAAAFTSLAKKAGLTNEQTAQMAAYGMEYMKSGMAAMKEAQQQQVAGWADQAKQELGKDFEAVMTKAGSGMEALSKAVPGLRAALNETGAGNRIEVIRAMAMIGELTGEDHFRGFGSATKGPTNLYPKTNFNAY